MTHAAIGFFLALVCAYGVYLVYTALAFGWRGVSVSPWVTTRRRRRALEDYLVQAGLERLRPIEFIAVESLLFLAAAGIGYAIYGGVLTSAVAGCAAAAVPFAGARGRRRTRQEHAREAWPRMIEEIRLRAVTLGTSIPQALFGVGLRGPEEMRSAFQAAHREWLMSTDLERSLGVLKAQLADPTADVVCETLLVAHQIGGADVDQRLRALVEDRLEDLRGRKDARSKQAGVRFARIFVVLVPLGMALVGLSIGDGRAAYAAPGGQLMVLVAFGLIGGCWIWAAYLLRLPGEERVFHDAPGEALQ